MSIRYHYQGRILEATEWVSAGHALKITDPEHPGRFHYVWPEQVIKDGVPAQDPYGMNLKGPTLHPEQFSSTRAKSLEPVPGKVRAEPPRVSTGGDVTLASICSELGIEASLARRVLRKKLKREGGSWTFSAGEVDQVKAILKEV